MDDMNDIHEPLRISAPWQEYRNKLAALLNPDPDIAVGDVKSSTIPGYDYFLTIYVSDHKKYLALSKLLDQEVCFGQVKMQIEIYDYGYIFVEQASRIGKYNILFKGNPLFAGIWCVADQYGNEHGYVQFKPEVVQYFNDDIGDANGQWSGLAQDIAKKIFHRESWATGVSFCTTKITEPEEEHNGEAAETTGQ